MSQHNSDSHQHFFGLLQVHGLTTVEQPTILLHSNFLNDSELDHSSEA